MLAASSAGAHGAAKLAGRPFPERQGQSGGLWINYLNKLSENHAAYAAPDRRIAASAAIRNVASR